MSTDDTSIDLRTSQQTQTITYSVIATDNTGISSVSIPGASQGGQSGDTYIFTYIETFNYDDYSYGNTAVTRTVTVTDNAGNVATDSITLSIAKIDNQSPAISLSTDDTSIDLRTSQQTQTITYSVIATDNTGISSVSIPGASQGGQSGDTYIFTETFNYDDYSYGNTAVTRTVTVTDNAGNSSSQTITITINKINNPPVFTSPNEFLVLENTNYIGTLSATDPEGDEVIYNVVETNNISLRLDSLTGALTFEVLPDYEQDSTNYVCVFSASDENGASSFVTNSINIIDDRTEDIDGDGLTEVEEEDIYGTSDLLSDTDGDSLSDFEETTGIISLINSNRYVFIKNAGITWHEARDDAVQRGGHLATVNTHEEWNTILDLYQAENGDGAWLGGTDENNEGQWEWVTGESWNDDVDYWSEYQGPQPDNGQGIEHYLEIWYYNEEWNDRANDWPNQTISGYILEFPALYSTNNINTDPNDADSDDDGLTDYQEVITYTTDPFVDADKDGDGYTDAYEVLTLQTNPGDIADPNQAPIITSTNAFTVAENTSPTLTMSATDINGDTLNYSLDGADASYFTINNQTGELEFNSAPDFELKDSYEIELVVNDVRSFVSIGDTNISDSLFAHYKFEGNGTCEIDFIPVADSVHWNGGLDFLDLDLNVAEEFTSGIRWTCLFINTNSY